MLCSQHEIEVFFIWQPNIHYGEKIFDDFERAMITHPALLSIGTFKEQDGIYQTKALRTTYEAIEKWGGKEFNHFYNLSHIFYEIDSPIYIDSMHLGPQGNEIVAKKIFEIIKK